jgi:hypothetical protein
MSINLEIDFNTNYITNSAYTKFLEVTMDNILSWNNHIDLLMKKIKYSLLYNYRCQNIHVCLVIKSDLLCFFHSAMSYGIIFWGNSLHSPIIFRIQKKNAIRIYGRMWE